MRRIVLDEIEIIGDRANPNTAEEALSLLVNKRIDLSPLMTHRFALNDFATALDTYENRKGGAVKVAVKPSGI
jgi:L-iditol 2-dehydrogenase